MSPLTPPSWQEHQPAGHMAVGPQPGWEWDDRIKFEYCEVHYLKVTPTTSLFDTDTDSGTAAMGLSKATHGQATLQGAYQTPNERLGASCECSLAP